MTADNKFFIPITAVYDNRDAHNLPAHVAHEMATPYSAPTVDFDEVQVLAASLGYELINIGTTKKPMFRLIRDGVMFRSNAYGGGLALFDVRAFLEAERDSYAKDIYVEAALEVRRYGVACLIQEPSWFYDRDESVNICLERARMQAALDRDSDRAANFGLSGLRGLGGLL